MLHELRSPRDRNNESRVEGKVYYVMATSVLEKLKLTTSLVTSEVKSKK